MHLFAAQSFGQKSNEFPVDVKATLFDYLSERKVTWRYYSTRTPTFAMFLSSYLKLSREDSTRFVSIDQFYADAAAGNLPQFALIDPDGTNPDAHMQGDEHPPAPATIGQAWLRKAVDALAKSKHWKRSAFFITYDEHGGLYDHVPPPKACPADDRNLEPEVFSSYGVRVPFLVVSPFARKGFVSHKVYDHTSIVRFVEARFVMPALSHRDANAEAPWDVFDFSAPPREAPEVPAYDQDASIVSGCRAVFE